MKIIIPLLPKLNGKKGILLTFMAAGMLLFAIGCKEQNSLLFSNSLLSSIEKVPDQTLFHFNVFGDSRDGNSIYEHLIIIALAAGKPAFNVHVGDMISSPDNYEQWPSFKTISEPLADAGGFWCLPGNHDVSDESSLSRLRDAYPSVPPEGYYTLGTSYTLNIFLNSEEVDSQSNAMSEIQFNWLEQQLKSEQAGKNRFVIVYIHRPLFPQNHHKSRPFMDNEAIHQLLLTYGVKLIFAGHEHNFSRLEKDGVHYIITGGAGSPLHDDSEGDAGYFHFVQVYYQNQRIIIRVIGISGDTLDQLSFNP
jgi:acid phosphatase type 7